MGTHLKREPGSKPRPSRWRVSASARSLSVTKAAIFPSMMVVVMMMAVMVLERCGRSCDKHDRDEARRQKGQYPALHVSTSCG